MVGGFVIGSQPGWLFHLGSSLGLGDEFNDGRILVRELAVTQGIIEEPEARAVAQLSRRAYGDKPQRDRIALLNSRATAPVVSDLKSIDAS